MKQHSLLKVDDEKICSDVLIIECLLAPPKLSREPEEQRVQLGDTLKVKIPISGKGPYSFKVKKDDQSLPDSDRVRVQEFDDYILVTIPGLLRFFVLFYFTNRNV